MNESSSKLDEILMKYGALQVGEANSNNNSGSSANHVSTSSSSSGAPSTSQNPPPSTPVNLVKMERLHV
jgi:hypothetical protein